LVHISDLSWTKRVKHPSEVLKKGQLVQAVILQIDAANRRLSLGVKQLQPDAWEIVLPLASGGRHWFAGASAGRRRLACFMELAPGVEALCHRSEIPDGLAGRARFAVADWRGVRFQDHPHGESEKKIGLSLRAVADDEEKDALERLPAAGGGCHHDH
jgi:small subunit ribosomal protein S1